MPSKCVKCTSKVDSKLIVDRNMVLVYIVNQIKCSNECYLNVL